ncbi:lipoprotein-releasing ABC transporter permease subunit [Idiomarina seosinensis]|uniref:lipoprotein-releasing ABC transporter permease subunit n=1 Tax=Idiomarina seosinensis TaxID=281739 RepID=UPI0038511F7A
MLTWNIARRFRKNSSAQGFLSFISTSSTLGIILGCAVLIAALSMMNGFQNALQDKLLKVVPHVEYQRVSGTFDNWQQIAGVAQADEAVVAVSPVIQKTAMAQSGRQFKGVVLQGIEPQMSASGINDFISAAAMRALSQSPSGIILGAGLAETLQLTVGEQVTLLLAQQGERAFQSPRRHTLTIVGLFEFGGEIDHQNAYVSLSTARQLAGIDSGVTGIRLTLRDVFDAPQVAQRVGNKLPDLVYVNHWMRTHGHLYRDIELVRTVIYLVLVLVMAVACFNIVSTLVLTVTKKRSQIAMLKTMGLVDQKIVMIFVWQGLQNGLRGACWGALAGSLLALSLPDLMFWLEQALALQLLNDDVYFVSKIPSQLHWQDVVLVTSVALAMSLLATLYPAWRATRVAPAKALHGGH